LGPAPAPLFLRHQVTPSGHPRRRRASPPCLAGAVLGLRSERPLRTWRPRQPAPRSVIPPAFPGGWKRSADMRFILNGLRKPGISAPAPVRGGGPRTPAEEQRRSAAVTRQFAAAAGRTGPDSQGAQDPPVTLVSERGRAHDHRPCWQARGAQYGGIAPMRRIRICARRRRFQALSGTWLAFFARFLADFCATFGCRAASLPVTR